MSTPIKYNEQELVSLLKAKDGNAFSYLYEHYSGALHNIVLQIVTDGETARDVLQEAFVNIWKKIDSYDPQKGRLFTWMLNVTRNLSIDTVRSKGFQNNQKNTELNDVTEAYTQVVKPDIDNIGLKKVLEKLKEEHRLLIDLSYFKGYTHDEISQMQGIPLGTVKTRIRTALIQLKEYLK
ncbi:MAG: RNA polymerase sigma factor [Chitinophagaceae bacterium]